LEKLLIVRLLQNSLCLLIRHFQNQSVIVWSYFCFVTLFSHLIFHGSHVSFPNKQDNLKTNWLRFKISKDVIPTQAINKFGRSNAWEYQLQTIWTFTGIQICSIEILVQSKATRMLIYITTTLWGWSNLLFSLTELISLTFPPNLTETLNPLTKCEFHCGIFYFNPFCLWHH